jgi:hypothetical protein
MTRRLVTAAFVLLTFIIFIGVYVDAPVRAQTSDPTRQAAWYQVNYGSNAFGGTFLYGQYGPDVGIGEQGTIYRYSNPLTGMYVSYQSTGIGTGIGGPLLGYGGMFSPVAEASYGPFAYGQIPTVASSPGFDTSGFLFGNLWGQGVNYFQSQYNPYAGLLFGLGGLGGFGSYDPYGGLFGSGRVGLSTGFGPIDGEDLSGAFRSSRGNIYGGVNLFYFEDLEGFED